MIITLVGSRNLIKPQNIDAARRYYKVSKRFADLGIDMRSGGAPGADYIAEEAYAHSIDEGKAIATQVKIYTPWKKFQAVRGQDNILHHLHVVPIFTSKHNELVNLIHPNPGALTIGPYKLHARNCNQVLGDDLNTPADAVVCWTDGGEVTGGTATAINLAKLHGIPVINLGDPDVQASLEAIRQLLVQHNII